MHAPAYEDISNRMHRGALALPRLGGPTDRPTWIIAWTDQASGLLDRILVRGEYRKVDCCDTCSRANVKNIKERQWEILMSHLANIKHD